MITPDDLPNRKEERRSKRKDEDLYKSNPVRGESSDLPPGHKNIRQKIKEEILSLKAGVGHLIIIWLNLKNYSLI